MIDDSNEKRLKSQEPRLYNTDERKWADFPEGISILRSNYSIL